MKRSIAPSRLTNISSLKKSKFVVPTRISQQHESSAARSLSPSPDHVAAENAIMSAGLNVAASEEQHNKTKTHNKTKDDPKAFRKPLVKKYCNLTPIGQTPSTTSCDSRPRKIEVPASKRYFSVVWCKRSTKKHKNWEGDAVLSVAQRSVSLLDTDGKEIGKSSGYKLQELATLQEGETLAVGGKEVEILGIITEENFLSGKCFTSCSTSSNVCLPSSKKSAPFSSVIKSNSVLSSNNKPAAKPLKARFDPMAPNALVLAKPPTSCLKSNTAVVDVVVDPHLSHLLRPHQQEGVKFLYECVMGYGDFCGEGAILADEMGLGKTLQVITLIWTLLKQNPIQVKPALKKVLIVTPGSLVKNWSCEFKKWLGNERLPVFAVSSDKKAEDFKNTQVYPVMIVSYEMFVRYVDVIQQSRFDLLVCDEGHRLKNGEIKTASLLKSLSTKKRVVLTGTPIQNDLKEFFTLADFCNPGILGSHTAFQKVYEQPILASKQPKCTLEEKQIGEMRAKELNKLTSSFILRRSNKVNEKYLPPKVEYVVFCQPSKPQVDTYKKFLSSSHVNSVINYQGDGNPHLLWIGELKKLCNYPPLLENSHEELVTQSHNDMLKLTPPIISLPDNHVKDDVNEDLSGKLTVLCQMLAELHCEKDTTDREKIVLVSNYTKTLDVLQKVCVKHGYHFTRLDGQTPVSKRQQIVEQFNSKYSRATIFLLSSKAGGVGLNLVGASRLILFDIDWNPANDLQAMARIWREGQKKKVHIYRLLTTGTIEEKIYQRQVAKQGLGNSIVDSMKEQEVQFSREDLKNLFGYHGDTACDTHDMLLCDCEASDLTKNLMRSNLSPGSDKNLSMSELNKWQHVSTKQMSECIQDPLLTAAQNNITFIFTSEINH